MTRAQAFRIYRLFLADECERCGAPAVLVHHRDDDFTNNDEENLESLCKRCHQLHHRCQDNLPDNTGRVRTRHPQPCEACGGMFVRAIGKTAQRFCSRSCAMRVRMAAHA